VTYSAEVNAQDAGVQFQHSCPLALGGPRAISVQRGLAPP